MPNKDELIVIRRSELERISFLAHLGEPIVKLKEVYAKGRVIDETGLSFLLRNDSEFKHDFALGDDGGLDFTDTIAKRVFAYLGGKR